MNEATKEKMDRFARNICRVPTWNGVFTEEEAECYFANHSDQQFCNGHLRQVKAEHITHNTVKLYTVPFS